MVMTMAEHPAMNPWQQQEEDGHHEQQCPEIGARIALHGRNWRREDKVDVGSFNLVISELTLLQVLNRNLHCSQEK